MPTIPPTPQPGVDPAPLIERSPRSVAAPYDVPDAALDTLFATDVAAWRDARKASTLDERPLTLPAHDVRALRSYLINLDDAADLFAAERLAFELSGYLGAALDAAERAS